MREELRLQSGLIVRIAKLHIAPSVVGILGGTPDGIWRGVIRDAPRRMEGAWGKRPTHLIEPISNSPFRKILPSWLVHVWLTSDHHFSEEADGSELVVVFFVDDLSNDPVVSLIRDRVTDLDWFDLARDIYG